MTPYQFIFSTQLKPRLARHIVLWLIFSLHFVIQNLLIGGPGEARTSRTFLESFLHFLYFLPIYFISAYFFIEIILPKFLYTRRLTGFIISFLLLFFASFISIYYSGAFYLSHTKRIPISQVTFKANKYHAIVDGMFVPFMLWGIAAGIKLSKKWYLQQRENEKLAKQKLSTELQVLKTSLHPKFLFHSLQTVQRHIDNSSDQSPALILQLSELLSYILYERDERWVPLEKELEIICSYINLEENRFAENISFKTALPEKTAGKYIVPFLLLSIVENSFEYFFESGQEDPVFTLTVSLNENTLHFELFFSRPAAKLVDIHLPEKKFIALQNQLQIQYAGLHHINIIPGAEGISIDLKLPLYTSDLINTKNNTLNEVPAPV